MCGSRHHHHHHHAHRGGRSTAIADDDLRASDAERERVVSDLRTHAGEGRLTVDELDERLERAYAARTRADLAALTRDLPRAPHSRRAARDEFAEHLRMYVLVMTLLVAIWALAGAGYFWPVWPALGWGIGLLSHASATRRTSRSTPSRAH